MCVIYHHLKGYFFSDFSCSEILVFYYLWSFPGVLKPYSRIAILANKQKTKMPEFQETYRCIRHFQGPNELLNARKC